MRAAILALLGVLAFAAGAEAAVKTEKVEYRHGDAVLEGVLAWDDAAAGKRPGVLVVHEWKGLNEYAVKRAEQLAALGYVAFAADMYGKGVRAETHEEAAKLSGVYFKDRNLMRGRALAALDVLKKSDRVDPKKLGAIGYCFGGATVLELARAGTDLAAVVSFHGALATPMPAAPGAVKAKVLVCHGADDKFIKPEDVKAFEDEMRKSGADWQMHSYGGVVHSFTVPAAGNDPSKGMAYDEKADKRSWRAMRELFQEVFGG